MVGFYSVWMVLALTKCNNQPAWLLIRIREIIQVLNYAEAKMTFLYIFSIMSLYWNFEYIWCSINHNLPTTTAKFSGSYFYFLMSYGCQKETLKHISGRWGHNITIRTYMNTGECWTYRKLTHFEWDVTHRDVITDYVTNNTLNSVT